MRFALSAPILVLSVTAAFAGPAEDGRAAVEQWAKVFNGGSDIEAMLDVYSPDAVLWGTNSTKIGSSPDDIRAYFEPVFKRGIKVTLGDHISRAASDTTVVDIGQYTFTIPNADGTNTDLPARYLVVVVHTPDGWKVAGHHSSVMPTPPAPAPTASK